MRGDDAVEGQLDMRRFAAELLRAVQDGEAGAQRAKLATPWGSTKTLVTDGGGVNVPPPGDQEQMLLQVTSPDGIPRPWIISMAGAIQQNGQTPLLTYPFAKFKVQFGSAGAFDTTEIDGMSDQFLMVFGNQITVSCSLDLFNAQLAALFSPLGLHLEFPKNMVLQASAAYSEGAQTKARRTFIVPPVGFPGPDTLLPIPYAATGVILRSFDFAQWLDPVTGARLLFETNGNIVQDEYNAADTRNAHDRGEYLSVPSMSDTIRIVQPTTGPPSSLAFCEFLMQP